MPACGDVFYGDNANYKVVEYEVINCSNWVQADFDALLILEVQRTNDLMFNLHHRFFPENAKYLIINCEALWCDSTVKYADSNGRACGTMDRIFPDVMDIIRPISKYLFNLTAIETRRRKQQ